MAVVIQPDLKQAWDIVKEIVNVLDIIDRGWARWYTAGDNGRELKRKVQQTGSETNAEQIKLKFWYDLKVADFDMSDANRERLHVCLKNATWSGEALRGKCCDVADHINAPSTFRRTALLKPFKALLKPFKANFGFMFPKRLQAELNSIEKALEAFQKDMKELEDSIPSVNAEMGKPLYQAPEQLDKTVKALKSRVRLVIVSGGAAMGKTALADEVGRQVMEYQGSVRENFRNGVVRVGWDDNAPDKSFCALYNEVLGSQPPGTNMLPKKEIKAITNKLKQQNYLLIIDNVDKVSSLEHDKSLDWLSSSLVRSKCLVTSRADEGMWHRSMREGFFISETETAPGCVITLSAESNEEIMEELLARLASATGTRILPDWLKQGWGKQVIESSQGCPLLLKLKQSWLRNRPKLQSANLLEERYKNEWEELVESEKKHTDVKCVSYHTRVEDAYISSIKAAEEGLESESQRSCFVAFLKALQLFPSGTQIPWVALLCVMSEAADVPDWDKSQAEYVGSVLQNYSIVTFSKKSVHRSRDLTMIWFHALLERCLHEQRKLQAVIPPVPHTSLCRGSPSGGCCLPADNARRDTANVLPHAMATLYGKSEAPKCWQLIQSPHPSWQQQLVSMLGVKGAPAGAMLARVAVESRNGDLRAAAAEVLVSAVRAAHTSKFALLQNDTLQKVKDVLLDSSEAVLPALGLLRHQARLRGQIIKYFDENENNAVHMVKSVYDHIPEYGGVSIVRRVTDKHLRHIATLDAVQDLDLSGLPTITSAGIAKLEKLTALTKLSLGHSACTSVAFLRHMPMIKSLDLRDCKQLEDAGAVELSALASLTQLWLRGCVRLTDRAVAPLTQLQSLQTLNLAACAKLSDASVKQLTALRASLTEVWLNGCSRLTDNGVAPLAQLTGLQALKLDDCTQVGDDAVKSLAALRSLTLLWLDGLPKLTDIGVAPLTQLTSLQALNLNGCARISDDSVKSLAALTSLTCLSLGGCTKLTDTGVAPLAQLTSLQLLTLSGCAPVSDESVKRLVALTSLIYLRLNGCSKLTNTGVAPLSQLTRLQVLNLGGCAQVSDDSVKRLAALASLTFLRLDGCSYLTDTGVAPLAQLTRLQVLNLGGCVQVSDDSVRRLAALASLTFLRLDSCSKLTDTGVAPLAQLTSLQWLTLSCCAHVSDNSVKRLAALASLTLLRLDGCSKLTNTGVAPLAQLTSLQFLRFRALSSLPISVPTFGEAFLASSALVGEPEFLNLRTLVAQQMSLLLNLRVSQIYSLVVCMCMHDFG